MLSWCPPSPQKKMSLKLIWQNMTDTYNIDCWYYITLTCWPQIIVWSFHCEPCSPSSLKTKASAWDFSQNLYVSQHTKTGTLFALASMMTRDVPDLDFTHPFAISAWAPSKTLVACSKSSQNKWKKMSDNMANKAAMRSYIIEFLQPKNEHIYENKQMIYTAQDHAYKGACSMCLRYKQDIGYKGMEGWTIVLTKSSEMMQKEWSNIGDDRINCINGAVVLLWYIQSFNCLSLLEEVQVI